MIYLNANSSNTVTLTLNEKKTLDNPYYFFKLTNDQSEKIFYAANVSINQDRYDQFTWIVTGSTSEVLANGWVNLEEGFYKYEAWESLTNSLVPSDWTALVERGKVYVSGSTQEIITYTGTNITNKIIYRP